MSAYEEEDATAAEIRRAPPVPFSRMFNDVKTSVPVNQVALMTSLQTNFGCSLTGRTDRGNYIADLLEDAIDFMEPLMYVSLWSETPLCHLPSELAIHALALDPNADPVALEREARSALTEAGERGREEAEERDQEEARARGPEEGGHRGAGADQRRGHDEAEERDQEEAGEDQHQGQDEAEERGHEEGGCSGAGEHKRR